MPKGIYKRTEEHKKNIGKSKKGQNLGRIPWNKGLRGIKTSNKGMISPMKGKKFTRSHRKNLSESHKGKIPWNKGKKGLQISWRKGMKFLPEQNSMYGKHHSNKTKLKMSKERKGFYTRNKNPNWKGGKSFEPYSQNFNNQFKEIIRLRENFMCIKCGMKEEDHKIIFKRNLSIHHINYDKKLTTFENCCATCVRCNTEANSNRLSWIKFFQSLLLEKYGYKYTKDNLNIVNLEIIENET